MRLILRGLGIWAGLIVALVATFAAASVDKYFDSAGVSIRYIEDGRSEPIVLAHGNTGNIERSWVGPGIIAELAKTHRVIAFDHRGHGKSGKLHDPAQYGPEGPRYHSANGPPPIAEGAHYGLLVGRERCGATRYQKS